VNHASAALFSIDYGPEDPTVKREMPAFPMAARRRFVQDFGLRVPEHEAAHRMRCTVSARPVRRRRTWSEHDRCARVTGEQLETESIAMQQISVYSDSRRR
jgi:hypothetical protein